MSPLTGHTGSVLSVCFDHTGKKLASGGGSGDHSVRLWSTESGAPIGSPLNGHSNSVMSVAWNNDGTKLASGSYDSTVRIWSVGSVGTFECQSPLTGHSRYFDCCFLLLLVFKRVVCAVNSQLYRDVSSVSFSSDGKQVASGSYDNTVKIWETSTGTCVSTLRGHSRV